MIKKLTFLAIILSFCVNAQKSLISDFQKADILLKTNNIDSAYFKFKILEQTIPKTDTLYKYSLWYYTLTTSQLEYENRLNEKFDKSLKLGIEALAAIEKGIPLFDAEFAKRKYFMIKNIVVSNFGLGDFNEGKKWKEKLYQAKEKKELPKGLDESFNFDFFRFENKNIWAYEWFHPLPKDRFSSTFTKVVYYVYSTDENGNDKDQLYRFHVLMFHGSNLNFDYVLTKKIETAQNESSGTLYAYTYKEDIDFAQLQLDIKEVLKGNLNPNIRKLQNQK
ncbi:MAG TPA: hypothetical protein VF465_14705 [Flavobacterium sp.]|uniref:hypothetical protein n=1 Tax=Flavobacterium sp. TaxID=239 RepID=UPI002ED0AB01